MDYIPISWEAFTPHALKKHYLYHKKGTPKRSLCQDYICLDTETSSNKDQDGVTSPIGWIYQWSLSYPKEGGVRWLVYGRRPSELTETLERIRYINGCDENNRILIFCHYLDYDYTYFHNFLIEKYNSMGNLLATGAHQIISWHINGLEFRDSLKLSQKGLAKWGEDLGVRHKKLVGEIDYDILRYQDTPLTRSDWRYMFRDIVTLDECIQAQLDYWDDSLKSIPLTLTGYVRREARKEFRKDKKNSKYFKNKELDVHLYKFLRSEFSGGLTHGNRFYMDKTVRVEEFKKRIKAKYPDYDVSKLIIKHRDFCSHYPSQQVCNYCPGGKFSLWYDYEQNENDHPMYHDDLMKLDRAFIAAIQISNLHVRKGVTLPYVQQAKVLAGKMDKLDLICDNGRVLHMLKGSTILAVNEFDLKWMVKQYTFDYRILKVYTTNKTPYPNYLRDLAKRFFYEKTLYKKEEKRIKKDKGDNCSEYFEAHTRTQISKAMLNSLYGMSATDPVRIAFTETPEGKWEKEVLEEGEVAKRLSKFFNNRNNFMNYEFGCWTTAEARDELLEFVELIGYDFFLYADTDSIFYLSTPEIEAKIEARNAELRTLDEEIEAYIDIDDERYYFNQFEDENENITEFRFLHSKCYAYVTDDGKLHTTIAGVPEQGGSTTRIDELGSIDDLKPGKVFSKCGGTRTMYPPIGASVQPREEVIDGHKIEVASYAIITNTTKELHSTEERHELNVFWEPMDAIL